MSQASIVGLPSTQSIAVSLQHQFSGKPCRICESPFIAYVRHIPMRRMRLSNPLYYCMECESFLLPQVYMEPVDQLQRDAAWHISVEERNTAWADRFFDAAFQKNPRIQSVLEIGCGTGTLLAVGAKRGLRVHGHDTNPYAPAIALERHGLVLDTTLWSNETAKEQFDLVVCISTFEHLTTPRALMAEIANYGRRTGAEAFISVPFGTERDAWTHLLEAVPTAPTNPLYLSDVHINHFSHKGFQKMAADYRAIEMEPFTHGWAGYWLRF